MPDAHIQTPRFDLRKDADAIIARSECFNLRHAEHYVYGAIAVAGVTLAAAWTEYAAFSGAGEVFSPLVAYASIGLTFAMGILGFLCLRRLFSAAKRAEFQSMVLAGGMNMHSQFCIIFDRDKTIVYSDRKSVELFGNKAINRFDELLGYEGLSENARRSLTDAIERRRTAQVSLRGSNDEGKTRELTIALDPLRRPDGYFLVRGF
ncbi:MAG: hypothetical protein ABW189_06810 [Rickettsiales bacterium]